MNSSAKAKSVAAGVVVLALLVVPAPLLPPHRLAEAVQSILGVSWKAAYLFVAIGLQIGFYGSVGLLAAFAVKRAPTTQGRLIQITLLPLFVIGISLLIRSAKVGHLPIWVNAAVPVAACATGTGLGLGLLYRRWKLTLSVALVVIGSSLWCLLGGASAELCSATETQLQRLVAGGPGLPSGEARFGALLQAAFALPPTGAASEDPLQQNRAAILALGIALGHERLASFVGLDRNSELVRQATALRAGTTLRGRDDWSRHFCLSAALAVLENPLVSDAGGLMKEQLDALTLGSGFSFGDLAADRAGVRFASTATQSAAAAIAIQTRIQNGCNGDDFVPPAADLPENLTVEQFRRDYGGVGSARYRQQLSELDARLDRCAGLTWQPQRN